MAKTATKKDRKFALLWSDCGDPSQLCVEEKFHPSLEAAKESANGFDDKSGTFWIAEVVATGTVAGFAWK